MRKLLTLVVFLMLEAPQIHDVHILPTSPLQFLSKLHSSKSRNDA